MYRACGLSTQLSRHTFKVVASTACAPRSGGFCGSAALASPKQRLLPLLDDTAHCERLLDLADKDPQLSKVLLASDAEFEPAEVTPLTQRQWFLVAINSFIPFMGFGFFDNALMIVAGEALDTTLCVSLGYTTMVAAALGNTLSDVVGLGLGGVIEVCAEKLGLPQPEATVEQQKTLRYKAAYQFGSITGIVTGCLLGMLPLVFQESRGEELRVQKHLRLEMCEMAEKQLADAVYADRASLFIVDKDQKPPVLVLERSRTEGVQIRIPLDGDSRAAQCYKTGQTLNAHHLPSESSKYGYLVENMLCIPIHTTDGVIGVVQLLNKQGEDRFSDKDEQTGLRFAVMLSYLMQKDAGMNSGNVAKLIEFGVQKEDGDKVQRLAEDIFEHVKHRLVDLVKADRTSVFLIDDSSGKLYTVIAEGADRIELEIGKGMVGHAAKTGQQMNVTNAYECPWFDPKVDMATGYTTRSAVMIPIRGADGRVIGVLQALNKKDGERFTEPDETVLKEFATQIAIAVEMKSESFGMFVDNFESQINEKLASS